MLKEHYLGVFGNKTAGLGPVLTRCRLTQRVNTSPGFTVVYDGIKVSTFIAVSLELWSLWSLGRQMKSRYRSGMSV